MFFGTVAQNFYNYYIDLHKFNRNKNVAFKYV